MHTACTREHEPHQFAHVDTVFLFNSCPERLGLRFRKGFYAAQHLTLLVYSHVQLHSTQYIVSCAVDISTFPANSICL